jgi:TolB-like protein/tetratricopeptide (TPR) repeat protein
MQFRFSDHILDVERRELRRGGQLVRIEPQVFDLLLHLLRNRDRVVTKDDLLTAVWEGRIVSESTLTSRINAARKAIGDSGVSQRLIRTVPRKGLRFVADVASDDPLEPPTSSLTRDRPSIAVLRFANLSEDPEQGYFAQGIVEELITGLSRIKWLLVISRHSAFAYESGPIDIKTIGRGLGVRYVLEGSVRRAGEKVRVTGQLTETETGRHVWAGRFDGTWGDIFTLQDEMTMSVISAVEPSLRKVETERARRKRPDSLDAYDLFLRALPFAATAMPDNADAALSLLEQAIGLEPDYAVAHGMTAWCHEQRYLRAGLHAANRDAALQHAHAAITLGSDDAMALALGGFVIAAIERDYITAIGALDTALALSPSCALAYGFSAIVRAWMGDSAAAIVHGRLGIRLSPYDPLIYIPYVGLAYAHYFAGEWEDAMQAARRACQANPHFSVPWYLLTGALIRLARTEEARASARRVVAVQPDFTVSDLISGGITSADRIADLADALRQAGLPD